MRRNGTGNREKFQETILLPPAVPSRLLFQVGPSGQDPIVDSVESEFRPDSLRVTQDNQSSVLVQSFSLSSIEGAKIRIQNWLNAVSVTKVCIRGIPSALLARLESECSLYLHNQTWICSAVVQDACVVITGHAEAINGAVDSVYQTIVEVGGIPRERISEIKESLSAKTAEDQVTGSGPDYRYVGTLADHASYIYDQTYTNSVPTIPVSIFDTVSVSPAPGGPNMQLHVYRKSIKMEKASLVPPQVMTRLEAAIQPVGVKVAVFDSSIVDIRCSDANTAVAEEMVRACVERKALGSASLSVQLPKGFRIDKAYLHALEKKWTVVIVDPGKRELILVGQPVKALCCKLDLDRKIGRLTWKEGPLTSIAHDCTSTANTAKRVEVACGPSVAVSSMDAKTVAIVGPSDTERLVARDCLNYLTTGSVTPLIESSSIVVPVSGPVKNQLETKWGCLVQPEQENRGPHGWAIQPRKATKDSVRIVSVSSYKRLGALLDLLKNNSVMYDFATLKFSVANDTGFVYALLVPANCNSLSERSIAHISSCMQVIITAIPSESVILIAGEDRNCVMTACELVRVALGLVSSLVVPELTTRVVVETLPEQDTLEQIETDLCCSLFPGNGWIDIVSKSVLRRAMAYHVLSGEATIEAVTEGWSKPPSTRAKKSSRRRRSASSDSDYDFPAH